MPRIRTLKPEFWADEKLSLLDATTRLVFLGLVSMADDAGRLVDNVKLLDGQLFPNTDDSSRDALDILARLQRITRYQSPSGQALIQIANWNKHQKVDNPAKYVLPGPNEAIVIQPVVPSTVGDGSREPSENLARMSRSDLRPTTSDLGPTTSDLVPPTELAAVVRLTVAANAGLAEHPHHPQAIPRIIATSGRSLEAADAILAAGVPIAFAESALYTLGKTHSSERQVQSLKYFVAAAIRLWQEESERAAVASSTRPATLATTGRGNLTNEQAFAALAEWEKKSA